MYLKQQSKFISFPYLSQLLYLFFISILSLLSVNSLLTFLSFLLLLISLKLVWRRHEPPIFAFIVFYHWVQISMKIFHANLLGKNVSEFTPLFNHSALEATYLSFIGLLVLSIAIHLILRTVANSSHIKLKDIAEYYSVKKLFVLYLFILFIYILLAKVLFVVPALTQLLVGFSHVHIISMYFIFLVALLQKQYKYIILIIIIETIIGFSGFFSTFKTPYILLTLAYFTIYNSVSFKMVKFFIPFVVFILALGLVWTGIKSDYRNALNEGEKTQVVTMNRAEQVNLFFTLVENFDSDKLSLASTALASRIAYIDLFGQVIDHVPKNIDFEYGSLWAGAVKHILTPRLLFPDKEILDDSQRTMKYTGVKYADLSGGTSIGIGYFAESYIDFGPYGMFLPIFLVGILYGVIYRFIIKSSNNKLLAYSIIIGILLNMHLFETRNDKLLGGLISAFIIIYAMKAFFLSSLFNLARTKERVHQ